MDVSIVVINFNTRELLHNCLKSIFQQARDVRFEVIIVDNNSSDGSAEMVASHFPTVSLIRNDHNPGFAAANNQAIAMSSGEYIFLLNPDTLVLDHAVDKLVGFMNSNSSVGAAGCKLLNADGTLQFSIGNFPTILNQIGQSLLINRLFPKANLLTELVLKEHFYDKDQDIDWVYGAALMVRRDVIDEVGVLDESFFLFSEEVDWCCRIKKAGWRVRFYAGAEIIHFGRGVGRTTEAVHGLFLQLLKSKLYFFKKHYSPLNAFFLRGLLLLNLLMHSCVLFLLGGLGVNKKAGNRHKMYWTSLKALIKTQVVRHDSR